MNLILLQNEDFVTANLVRLYDRRLQHLQKIHKARVGDQLRVGQLNGQMGEGQLRVLTDTLAELEIHLHQPAPPALPVTLIIALPRPKMLRRILQTAATMGVKQLHLINAFKVEKSYWQTPWLSASSVKENFVLGLEQGMDTQLPQLHLHPRFKPFVEDLLPALCANTRNILAHPGTATPCPRALTEPVTLAIGPEGGFTPYEVNQLTAAGFTAVHLGQRILRVETAVPVLLAKLFD